MRITTSRGPVMDQEALIASFSERAADDAKCHRHAAVLTGHRPRAAWNTQVLEQLNVR